MRLKLDLRHKVNRHFSKLGSRVQEFLQRSMNIALTPGAAMLRHRVGLLTIAYTSGPLRHHFHPIDLNVP
jgi:hypothetical protein